MISTIFYTVLHIRGTFNEGSSSDKNYLRRGASFSRRKSKVCTWHCIIPKVTPLSLLHDERTRHPRLCRSSDRARLEMVALWRDSRR